MARKRIDEPTGTETVGHEWDGIEELDTPLPRWWLITFILSCVFALVYVVLYPSIPLGNRSTRGTLDWSSRGQLDVEMANDLARRGPILKAIATTPVEQLPANPQLLRQAIEGGRAAFKVHCVQCHGSGAAGFKGYPNLNDDDWLWGGDLASIETTLLHGIRNPDHDLTRVSQMPAFGEILQPAEIAQVVAYVRTLSGAETPTARSAAGATIFANNCAACHGENGKGGREFGAPNLTDGIWLYGGDKATLTHTIKYSRAGVMPRWNNRLTPATIRMLAAYVHSLGGGEATPVAAPVTAQLAQPVSAANVGT